MYCIGTLCSWRSIVQASGTGTNLKVGGGGTKSSKSTIDRFGERFRDGQYSLVSFLFAVLLYTHDAPRAQPFAKVGDTCPRAPWSRRHWFKHELQFYAHTFLDFVSSLSFLSAQVYPVPLLFTLFYHPLFLISVVLLSFFVWKKNPTLRWPDHALSFPQLDLGTAEPLAEIQFVLFETLILHL